MRQICNAGKMSGAGSGDDAIVVWRMFATASGFMLPGCVCVCMGWGLYEESSRDGVI